MASKHWLCLQEMDRHGKSMRNVDKGHFNDKTDAVVTISASRALLTTEFIISTESSMTPQEHLLSLRIVSFVIRRPVSSFFTKSATGTVLTTYMSK